MERNINVWLLLACPPLGTWPAVCPDWGLNRQPFSLQAGTQSTEPHQPGLITYIFNDGHFSCPGDCSKFFIFINSILIILHTNPTREMGIMSPIFQKEKPEAQGS